MGSIARKGQRFYALVWDRVTKKQRWKLLPKDIQGPRAARTAMRVLQDASDRRLIGLPTQSSKQSSDSWGKVAARLLAEIKVKNGRESWYLQTRAMVRRLKKGIGNQPIREVTIGMCRAYELWRLGEIGESTKETLRKEIMFFRRIWKRAIEVGCVSDNPWQKITLPKRAPRSPKFLSIEQFGALVKVAPAEWMFRWQFLVQTGARLVEARTAQWEQMNFQAGVIRLKNAGKGKGTKEAFRTIPLPAAMLAELRRREGKRGELIFEHIGEWTKQFTKDRRAAGIADMPARNRLRHTFASWLAMSGLVTILELRYLLGHESIESTEVYAQLIPGQNRAVASILDENYRRSIESQETAKVVDIG